VKRGGGISHFLGGCPPGVGAAPRFVGGALAAGGPRPPDSSYCLKNISQISFHSKKNIKKYSKNILKNIKKTSKICTKKISKWRFVYQKNIFLLQTFDISFVRFAQSAGGTFTILQLD